MAMARSRNSIVVAAWFGLICVFGVGCGPADPGATAESSAVVAAEASDARSAETTAEAQTQTQAETRCLPGGHTNSCAFGQFCCNGHCVPYRPDVHCLGGGEGASE